MEASYIAVIIGVSIPTAIFLVILFCVCIARCRQPNTNAGYSEVSHELDDEEIEFKRMIEMQSDFVDDIDNLYASEHGSDEDDLAFDNTELNRLQILEKYRNNLVASANASLSGDQDKDLGDLQLWSPSN